MDESLRLLHLAMAGISGIRRMPRLIGAVADLDESNNEPERTPHSHVEMAKAEAALADAECNAGFPLLHAHALVSVART